jgi:L-alanine-DL-glutamate epimerase-like enolase superfamily enzyme
MDRNAGFSRRKCLKMLGATAAAGLGGPIKLFETIQHNAPEPVCLEAWEVIDSDNNCARNSRGRVLRLLGTNGAQAGLPAHICDDLSGAEGLLEGRNLLDHDRLFDFLVEKKVPHRLRRAIDILGWDLHARMDKESLAALLGAKRTRLRRYGDVRWRHGDTPESYGRKVAEHLSGRDLTAAKLHFPGVDHPRLRLPLDTVLATLFAARRAAGPQPVLAYDPHPGWAAATEEDVLAILRVMEQEAYEWLEEPYNWNAEGAIERYVKLLPRTNIIIQQEESGDCGYDRFVRWAEAGAVEQWTYDVLIHGGITPAVRILRWAAANSEVRPVRVNLHWSWTPHAHLLASVDEEIAPYFESPGQGEIPWVKEAPAYSQVPRWQGVYWIEKLEA